MLQSTQNSSEKPRWSFLAFVFIYSAIVKVMPFAFYRLGMDVESQFNIYPWSFTPIFAFCVFGGAMYQSKFNSLWIPLAAMFAGDLGIWAITGKLEWAFYSDQVVIYFAFALCPLLGFMLRSRRTWMGIAGAGIGSCLLFFLITNYAVWVGSKTYPQNLTGLATCYAAGLPFLRNSLISTVLFSGLLFSPVGVHQTVPAGTSEPVKPVPAGS